ncbi:CAP domain-containing protein [Pendulispora rubella]|uniref:CAP domain-containing protein n=1 Tax=Pendulispora rubella TaxID=2741070 RepID=A0ABZ2LFE3_9BACT
MRTFIGLAAFGAALLGLSTYSRPASAYGEEKNGFPNWAERVIHQWTNRAHVDPQAELSACGSNCPEKSCYTAIAPVAWGEAANRAARFHAANMIAMDFFDHSSKCSIVGNIKDIYPGSCQGQQSCACQGGTATCSGSCPGPGERMSLFGASGGAENIAWDSNGTPDSIFKMWIYEQSSTSACEFTGENGHRWNILKNTGSLGVGVVVGSGKFMAVQDFSGQGAPPKVPSGSHFPRQAASVEAWANWYSNAAPKGAVVNVDGACTTMTKKRGSDTNAAYSATLTNVASGCRRYFFRFTDSSNAIVDYPTTGTLGIGPASCADWQDGPHNACGGGGGGNPDAGGGGGNPDAGGGGGGGNPDAGSGGGGDPDAGSVGGGTGGGGGGGTGGGGKRDAGTGPGASGAGGEGAGAEDDGTEIAGGSCAAAPGNGVSGWVGLAAGVAALCASRRRRR